VGSGGLRRNVVRLACAALGVVAMAYQFGRLATLPTFGAGNFFSFFTIQSNLLAVAALALTAIVRREERGPALDAARTAATMYVTITGVVFAVFLKGLQESLDTHNAFVNGVVHYVIPAVLLIDWLLDPPRHRVGPRVAAAWLCYPLAWFAYTVLRGRSVGWYPYPFVDVSRHGYGGVLLHALLFLVGFAALAAAFAAAGNGRASRAVPSPAGTSSSRGGGV